MTPATTTRQTAAERREAILEVALVEFANRGLHGTSTEDIARRAGISQPYLFRLFGTKKELFKATVAHCFELTLEMFQSAAAGHRGEDVLAAIGEAYMERLQSNPLYLRAQMHAYVACEDPEVCAVVRAGYGRLVEFAERASGCDAEHVGQFFAKGMLLNVIAAMDLLGTEEPWAQRLLQGLGKSL
jgi:AcrR family transcriptional regulator